MTEFPKVYETVFVLVETFKHNRSLFTRQLRRQGCQHTAELLHVDRHALRVSVVLARVTTWE